MEYPIIDTLTNAYIRNGWTGLDVKTGKNLFNPINTVQGYINDSNGNLGGIINTGNRASDYIEIKSNTYYIISPNKARGNWAAWYDMDKNYISGFIQYELPRLSPSNAKYIRFTANYLNELPNWADVIQLEEGSVVTPYEPYYATTDIFSRTRLPLIRYFPHPVIDALQRAAAGTQTADDTEVLRHYLTPFGIGGI